MKIKPLQDCTQEVKRIIWLLPVLMPFLILIVQTNLYANYISTRIFNKVSTRNVIANASFNKPDNNKESNNIITSTNEEGAQYYWVGGTGNWSDVSHWATTSGGNIKHTTVPGQYNDVFFDAKSFSAPGQTVTIDVLIAEVKNLDWASVSNNPTFTISDPNPTNYSNIKTLNIYGSLSLSKYMNIRLKIITFLADTKGNTIDLGGNDLGWRTNFSTEVNFRSNGQYEIVSDFSVSMFNLFYGNIKTNNYPINIKYFYCPKRHVQSSLDLGSSKVDVKSWYVDEEALHLNAGTSVLTMEPTTYSGYVSFQSTGLVYHNVTFRGGGTPFHSVNNKFNKVNLGGNISKLVGDNTYDSLTLEPGVRINIIAGTTQKVGNLLAVGQRNKYIKLYSGQAGLQATIRQISGTVNGQYLDLMNIKAEGGAIFNAANSIDQGNNVGWKFTAPKPVTYYWVGGTGSWGDNSHWATTSGGKINHTSMPSQIDDVIFDANSFTGPGQVVNVDVSNANAKNIDWTGAMHHPSLIANVLNIHGSLILGSNIKYTLGSVHLRSDVPGNLLKVSGEQSPSSHLSLYFEGTGEYLLQDNLSVDGIYLNHGIFNTNSHNVNVKWALTANYDLYSRASRTLILGNSKINIGFSWNLHEDVNLNAGTSTIRISGNNLHNKSFFSGANLKYHRIITNGNINISNNNSFNSDQNTIDSLEFEPGSNIKLYPDYKLKVKNLIVTGTENNKIHIESVLPGYKVTILQTSGLVNGKHLILQDVTAEGGAKFYAANSEDKGNNSGWLFVKEQVLSFDFITNKTYGDAPFALNAKTSSDLPVSLSVVSGPAIIKNDFLTITGIGVVTVKAVQEGNAVYAPASEVIRTFTVVAKELPNGLTWNMRYGGASTDRFAVVIKTKDGGYILGGYSDSKVSGDKSQNSRGGTDYWIIKTDAAGKKQWDKRYGGLGHDYLNRIIQTKDGGYLLAGSSRSGVGGDKTEPSRGNQDYWIVKITERGEKEWDKTFGGSGFDDLRKVNQLSSGEYFLAGVSNSPLNGDKSQPSRGRQDYWVLKLNSNGTKIWDKRYGGSSDEYLESFTKTNDGGFLLAGSSASGKSGDKTQASRGGKDYWLVRIDSHGNILWDQRFGGNGHDELYSIGNTREGNFFVAGHSTSEAGGDKSENSQGGKDFWMLKLNANGTKRWDKRYGGSGNEELRSIIQTNDGGFLLAGSSDSEVSGDKSQANQGNTDYWVLKIDATGGKIWDRRFGGTDAEELRYIQQTTDGGYLLGGRSNSGISGNRTQPSQGHTDYWLIKVPSNGGPLMDEVAVNQRVRMAPTVETIPTKNINLKTSPNPFTDKITVSFTSSEDHPVNVTVFDIHGRKVITLYQGEVQANKLYQKVWRPSPKQVAGIYIVRLQTNTKVSHQKVLLER